MSERGRRGITRDVVSQIASLPAPVGGWNARSPLEAMKADEAITLENWVATPEGVVLRMGNEEYATGLGAPVESLMEYAAPALASRKMFAAAGTSIWEVSAPGAGVAAVTGLTNARWQHTMCSTGAGNFLYAVNGADAPRFFNGTSWASSVLTGVTASSLVNVCLHKARLWFCQNDSLKAWYLPPLEIGAVSSAAAAIDLGAFFKLGGYLQAIGTWSRDGGDGSDDAWVAISSEGEVAIYTGTDPTSAATWALVGVYRIPKPIGRRCFVKAGADLGILTTDGLISLSETLPLPGGAQRKAAITDKISPAFGLAWQTGKDFFGWQCVEVPAENLVMVNVPIESGRVDQFVMCTENGAWSRWTGIKARSVGVYNNRLLFGMDDGTIWIYRQGQIEDHSDVTTPITATMQTAFSPMGRGYRKRVTMIKPLMQGPPGYLPRFNIRVDFDRTAPSLSVVSAELGGSLWDVENWDEAEWATRPVQISKLQSATGFGTNVSVAFAVQSDVKIILSRFDIVFEPSQGII